MTAEARIVWHATITDTKGTSGWMPREQAEAMLASLKADERNHPEHALRHELEEREGRR